MLKLFGKNRKKKFEIMIFEGGRIAKVFETAIWEAAAEFLRWNMHAEDTEMSVIESGLRDFDKVVVTILTTGKVIQVTKH